MAQEQDRLKGDDCAFDHGTPHKQVSNELEMNLTDLERIRARIMGKLDSKYLDGELSYQVRDSPDKLQGAGITINDRRGEWLMIFDEETNNTVFYNPSTGQIREDRPKGWVRLLASRFNKD